MTNTNLKVTSFQTGKAVTALTNIIVASGGKYNIEMFHVCNIDDQIPNEFDFQKAEESNIIIIQNTWGSLHPSRNNLSSRNAQVNHYNQKFVEIANNKNIPLIVLETATFSRFIKNYCEYDRKLLPAFYRMAKNHWMYGLSKWCQPLSSNNRVEIYEKLLYDKNKIQVNLKEHIWKNKTKDGVILILPGLEHDPTNNYDLHHWITKTIDELQRHTKQQIIIKLHPLSLLNLTELCKTSRIGLVSNNIKLQTLFPIINAAVIDNSTSIFELVEHGIPCFTSPLSFGAELGNTNLTNIDFPDIPNDIDYYKWVKKMSYTEFSIIEFSHEYILDYFIELVNA